MQPPPPDAFPCLPPARSATSSSTSSATASSTASSAGGAPGRGAPEGAPPRAAVSYAALARSLAASAAGPPGGAARPQAAGQGGATPHAAPAGPQPTASGSAKPQGKATKAIVSFSNIDISCKQRRAAVLRGYENEGNTCFANCIFQTLIAAPPFYNFLFGLRGRRLPGSAPLLHTFVRFVEALGTEEFVQKNVPDKQKTDQVIRLSQYFGDLLQQFDPERSTTGRANQEDAQEFLTFLLDQLHKETRSENVPAAPIKDEWEEVGKKNKTSKIRESPIFSIFGSRLRSCLKMRGAKASIVQESFYCLPLDITPPRIHSLEDALLAFTTPELLDWDVRTCKEYKFESLPYVLCFQLKRFTFTDSGPVKFTKHITFPFELALPHHVMAKPGSEPQYTYSLCSVVSHYGADAGSGHYKCDIRRVGTWFAVDDVSVRRVSPRDVSSRQAYLLVFVRNVKTK